MVSRLVATSALLSLLLTGCTQSTGTPGAAPRPTAPPLTVFAAASLTDVMTTIGADFERWTGVPVTFSFSGSADLVAQLSGGAPADILATADLTTMDKAMAAGVITAEPSTFATNTLTIAVEPNNPHGITSLADLGRPGLIVVICATQVPCGATTAAVTADAGVTLVPASEENSVTDVLGKVTSGQADAGVVWSTDIARTRGKAAGIAFAEAAKRPSTYLIAPVAGSSRIGDAERFMAYVTGPAGERVLTDAGFRRP